jgi:hypothetical protein
MYERFEGGLSGPAGEYHQAIPVHMPRSATVATVTSSMANSPVRTPSFRSSRIASCPRRLMVLSSLAIDFGSDGSLLSKAR